MSGGCAGQVSSNSMKLHEAVQQMSSELDAKSKLLEQARVELSLSSHAREAIRAERSTNDELRKQVKDTTEQLTNLAQVAAQVRWWRGSLTPGQRPASPQPCLRWGWCDGDHTSCNAT